MTPARDAAALRRLYARKAKLEAELRVIDQSIVSHGNRLSRAKGVIVPLRGPALLRLANEYAT